MNHDPEAAWPLTPTDQGYIPNPAPSPTPLPPNPVAPYAPRPMVTFQPGNQSGTFSPSQKIAVLAIVLGLSIPLTAIATSMMGIIGLVIVWVGIIGVVALAFGKIQITTQSRKG
ncbi:MAG: hypothetical protein LBI33_06315 [Propionibacteriaceae bacterium]|jgi:hypothetical protein|nr:hypothetical protein [Propionibacteriaceae bacterium]